MNRRRGVGLGLTLFIAILVGYLISTGLKKSEVVSHQDKAISKTVVQRYELKNKTGRLQRDVIFWVYGPVEQTVANRIADVEVSHEYQVDRDDQGNRVMVFQLPQIPPYGSVIIDINSRLKANTEQSDEAMTLLQRYLQAEPLIESDDPRLVKVARLFRQQESEVRAKAVYQWVVENIKRSD